MKPEPEIIRVSINKQLGRREANRQQRAFTLALDFTAPNGITILFGPSGSGKTTCLRAIAGIVTPDTGQITVGKRVFFDSTKGIDLPIQQRRVGFVFQDYTLFPHLTSEQNVMYGIREAMSRADKHKRAQELMELLGIAYAARQYPRELSGGESQRVALARALASDPALMLLDEPLSALDQPTRKRLLAEIRAVQQRTEIPFLYVTHNVQEAQEIGTYVVTLRQGKIEQKGYSQDILQTGS